jgi:Flp pilus assembly protein TadG
VRRLIRSEAGTATIEGIIVMPLAISLMVGGVEFGRIFSAYSTADKSMRSAGRYLARVPPAAICSWGSANARNLAVYGQTFNTGSPLLPGWTTGTVTLVRPDCGAGFADPLVIELRAAIPFTLQMLDAFGFSNTVTLNVRHEERHIGE